MNSGTKIFEVISVYFANCYWNTLYSTSLDFSKDNNMGLKDAYVTVLKRYNMGFCATNNMQGRPNQHYVKIIKDIHNQYVHHSKTNLSLKQFINFTAIHLVPDKHNISWQQKTSVFRAALTKSVSRFTLFVLDNLNHVLNGRYRTQKEYVLEWKRRFYEYLEQQRDDLTKIILAKKTGTVVDEPTAQFGKIIAVLKEKLKAIHAKYAAIAQEKADLVKKYNRLVAHLQEKEKELIALKNRRASLIPSTPPPVVEQLSETVVKLEPESESESSESLSENEFNPDD